MYTWRRRKRTSSFELRRADKQTNERVGEAPASSVLVPRFHYPTTPLLAASILEKHERIRCRVEQAMASSRAFWQRCQKGSPSANVRSLLCSGGCHETRENVSGGPVFRECVPK